VAVNYQPQDATVITLLHSEETFAKNSAAGQQDHFKWIWCGWLAIGVYTRGSYV